MIDERAVQCSVGEESPGKVTSSPVDRAGREAGGRTAGDVEEVARSLYVLREEVDQLKRSLTELVRNKRAITSANTLVVEGRARLNLRRRAYEESKRRLRLEYEELQQVAGANQRREERLARVRGKNFTQKVEDMTQECVEQWRLVGEKDDELQIARKELISAALMSVFPIEVQPLSLGDAGEEDYLQNSVIDCTASVDVDDGWVLSGVHRSPTPHISIVTASLPVDGDYTQYLQAAKERRKAVKEAAERACLPPTTEPDPLQPLLSVPAGLQYTAHFVELVASVLDQPLPHPLPRHLSIIEYGNQHKKKKEFLDSVAKLDDCIIYLCFSQNLPLSALSPGHTLTNLLALVTHTELGRRGAFECHPELAVYRGGSGDETADRDNEPPTFYTADHLPLNLGGSMSESEGEEEKEEEGKGEEEEEGSGEEWESVEVRDAAAPLAGPERKGRVREKRRLNYESSYLDYVAPGASSPATEDPGKEEGEAGEVGARTAGIFGTLSSLLSSTFTRTSN